MTGDESPMLPGRPASAPPGEVPPLTRTNARVLLTFLFGMLGGLALVASLWDVWLGTHLGGGATISWSLALLGYRYPLAVAAICYALGAVHWGLMVHFWNPMPRPQDAAEIDGLRADNARLAALLGGEKGEG